MDIITTHSTTPQKSMRVPRNITSHKANITLASKPSTNKGTVSCRLTPMRCLIW